MPHSATTLSAATRPVTGADLDHALFARNMAAFERMFPMMHQSLAKIAQPRSTLVATADGGFDVEFGGVLLYGGNARTVSKRRVKDFFDVSRHSTRFAMAPVDTRSLDVHSNARIYSLMQRAVETHGIKLAIDPPVNDSYHLVVLGVGLAEHIPLLVKQTNCQHLILFEANTEFLYHSLFTFDWEKFFASFLRNGRQFSFMDTTGSYQDCAQNILYRLRGTGLVFTEGTFIYFAYQSAFLEAIGREMSKNRELIMMGLGFLEDELDMVRNTQKNLADFNGRYFQKKEALRSIPAFVVAAGPSLDNDLEFIRANADRAIVISCGTTLRILLRNGIRPDFHMEMENVPAVYDLIAKLSADFSLKDITLVASTTIDPKTKSLFENVVFYFRPGLASHSMFLVNDDSSLSQGMPTVANLGLVFAHEIGCRSLYLFGVDLGARDPGKHHAKDAAYNVGELEFTTTIDQPMPGNLGGTVYSERIYLWSRDIAQQTIATYAPRFMIYNCSDGIRIEGTTPKLSRTITLPPQPGKDAASADILAAYPPYTRAFFDKSWTDPNLVRRTLEFRDLLLSRADVAAKPKKSDFPLWWMAAMFRDLVPFSGVTTSEIHYFRGTMLQAMLAMYYYAVRVIGDRQRRVFHRLMKEEMLDLIAKVADRVVDFYRELDSEKIARDEKEAADLLKTEKKGRRRQKKKSRADSAVRPRPRKPARGRRSKRAGAVPPKRPRPKALPRRTVSRPKPKPARRPARGSTRKRPKH